MQSFFKEFLKSNQKIFFQATKPYQKANVKKCCKKEIISIFRNTKTKDKMTSFNESDFEVHDYSCQYFVKLKKSAYTQLMFKTIILIILIFL